MTHTVDERYLPARWWVLTVIIGSAALAGGLAMAVLDCFGFCDRG